jgi:hypothetical protein
MMHSEFEEIAKVNISTEQYNAIETLYMASSLNKVDFVKSIRGMLKSLVNEKPEIVTINITDRSGFYTTPNGCWLHLINAVVISRDLSISTGKEVIEVKRIEDSYKLGYETDGILKDYQVTFVD